MEEEQQQQTFKAKAGKKKSNDPMNDFASYDDFAHLLEEDDKAVKDKQFTGAKRNLSNFEYAQKRFVNKKLGKGPNEDEK